MTLNIILVVINNWCYYDAAVGYTNTQFAQYSTCNASNLGKQKA